VSRSSEVNGKGYLSCWVIALSHWKSTHSQKELSFFLIKRTGAPNKEFEGHVRTTLCVALKGWQRCWHAEDNAHPTQCGPNFYDTPIFSTKTGIKSGMHWNPISSLFLRLWGWGMVLNNLLYFGVEQLEQLSQENWINIKQLSMDWHFPHVTVLIIWQFIILWRRLLPPNLWMMANLLLVYRVMDEQVRLTRRAHGRTILVKESTDKKDTIIEDNES
jgi:hypothetical protein